MTAWSRVIHHSKRSNPGIDIYYWPRSFLLRAHGFDQPFRDKPYQRLAATVIVAMDGMFELQIDRQPPIIARAALVGANARRKALRLPNTLACLVDVGIDHADFSALNARLADAPVQLLDEGLTDGLIQVLAEQGSGVLTCEQARTQFDQILALVIGVAPCRSVMDNRVARVLDRINALPRDEVRVSELAGLVELSESRLRTLVQKSLGCSLASYLRWAAAWKTLLAWQPGRTLTQAAMDAGFHDLAHATHTFNELFGLPPSRLLDTGRVALHPCEL